MHSKETPEELKERIAELEQTIRVLQKDLIHDVLTGLKTRNFFNEEAKKFFHSISADVETKNRRITNFKDISFIFFDIDHFKKVNDTHGHIVGDEVLKSVAHLVEGAVRDEDIVCRWGGEEIVIALLGADEKEAMKKAEEIRSLVEQLAFNNMPEFDVTVSAGVASFKRGVSFENTLIHADKAMYHAKETGRNKVVVYSEIKQE